MAAVRKLQTNVNYDKINSSSEFQLQACEAVRAALSAGPDTNIPYQEGATAWQKREWVELVRMVTGSRVCKYIPKARLPG